MTELPVQAAADARDPAAAEDGCRALVARAQAGDRGAFADLYRRFLPMVHAVALAAAAHADVEDVVQDAFLSAWRALGELRHVDHVGGWLCTIARNRAVQLRGRARPATALPEELPGRRTGGTDGAEILATLKALPEAYRETLAMRLVEGMTGPEIAAATGLTHGSVRVNLTRGMHLLREALRERGFE